MVRIDGARPPCKMYYMFAHSRPGRSLEEWEPLANHLAAVGRLAEQNADPLGLATLARAAGLLHDIGKCSTQFQDYIAGRATSGGDHSTAGAIEANARYVNWMGRLIAFAVAGHHSGLADGGGAGGGTLADRLAKTGLDYSGWQDHVGELPEKLAVTGHWKQRKDGYTHAFLGRMLFSCLIDADFIATEAFYGSLERSGHRTLTALRERLDAHLERFVEAKGEVNALRAEVLAHARARAADTPGLFTMTVPTGGGKTLASLAFALDHAIAHGLRRVVYVIPYTSIIEQTAGIFRAIFGDDDVLEHHGNVDWDAAAKRPDDEGTDGWHKLRRASENWDVPIVVTTAVQFFESLHASRNSRARKLHNIAASVVILDEAQTLPVSLLRPCLAAITELANNYRTSIVLCTATQPAVRAYDGFKSEALPIGPDRELAPHPQALYERLRRVAVEHGGTVADAAIAARFADAEQMLCIVNSRKHAQALYAQIAGQPGARHLTTLMCPAHRRAVLAEVREDLQAKRPVRLVATSLIEAGVDVDFPEVWRAETGLDSIAQAAGRCNREGQLDGLGRVVVFESADHASPRQFAQNVEAARTALRLHPGDPLGLDAVRAYFNQLYWAKGDELLDAAKLDGERFPILARIEERHANFDYPYASIARAFQMIDDVMDPVIVPWKPFANEVERLIAELRFAAHDKRHPPGKTLRRFQQFTVSIPTKARTAMLASGAAQVVHRDFGDRFVMLASSSLYSEAVGLSLDPFEIAADALIFSP